MRYRVDYSYSVPYWGDIELDTDSVAEAEEEALRHIEMMFPEAIDIELTEVNELR